MNSNNLNHKPKKVSIVLPLDLTKELSELYKESSIKSINDLKHWNKETIIPVKTKTNSRSEVYDITRNLKGSFLIRPEQSKRPIGYEPWLREIVEKEILKSEYLLMMQRDVVLHPDTITYLTEALEVSGKKVTAPMLK